MFELSDFVYCEKISICLRSVSMSPLELPQPLWFTSDEAVRDGQGYAHITVACILLKDMIQHGLWMLTINIAQSADIAE